MKATQYITGAISKRQSRKNSANFFLLNFYQRGSHQLGCSVDAYLVPTACTDCGPSCWGAPAPLLRATPSKHPSLPSLLSSFTLVPSPLYQMNGGSICLFRMAHLFIGKHLHWSSDCSCSSLLSFSQPNCIVVHLWLQWQQTPFCSQSNPAPPRRILSYTSLPIWMLLLHSPAQWAVLTHNAGPHLCRLLIRLSFQILAGILHLFLALTPPSCTNTSFLH